jgi:hypothetical protein
MISPFTYTFSAEARLVDVDALDDRTSDGNISEMSRMTTRREVFRTNVIERDGTCVITGDIALNCNACHILPHAKGNDVRPCEFSIATLSLAL